MVQDRGPAGTSRPREDEEQGTEEEEGEGNRADVGTGAGLRALPAGRPYERMVKTSNTAGATEA